MVPQLKLVQPGGNPHQYGGANSTENIVTFERLQFKSATANNGKRRAAQQYYCIIVDLYAQTETGALVKIATTESAPLVVRGRSPGHYTDLAQGANADSSYHSGERGFSNDHMNGGMLNSPSYQSPSSANSMSAPFSGNYNNQPYSAHPFVHDPNYPVEDQKRLGQNQAWMRSRLPTAAQPSYLQTFTNPAFETTKAQNETFTNPAFETTNASNFSRNEFQLPSENQSDTRNEFQLPSENQFRRDASPLTPSWQYQPSPTPAAWQNGMALDPSATQHGRGQSQEGLTRFLGGMKFDESGMVFDDKNAVAQASLVTPVNTADDQKYYQDLNLSSENVNMNMQNGPKDDNVLKPW
jgi:hypothetical protein